MCAARGQKCVFTSNIGSRSLCLNSICLLSTCLFCQQTHKLLGGTSSSSGVTMENEMAIGWLILLLFNPRQKALELKNHSQ